MNKKAIRIIAIVLAALMFIGVFAGAIINSFALENAAVISPDMGERSKLVPILIVVIGIVVATVCFVIPKIKAKSTVQCTDENN